MWSHGGHHGQLLVQLWSWLVWIALVEKGGELQGMFEVVCSYPHGFLVRAFIAGPAH